MKKIARAIISMGVVFAFAACSWEVPQNVSVKTNADYNFSLGTFEKEFDNNMDLNSMMGDTGVGKDDIHTYDYFPGKLDKNTQHFLLEIKLFDQALINPVPNADALNTAFGSNNTVDLSSLPSGLSLASIPSDAVNLDFNPSVMLETMKDALGDDIAGKIDYSSVPLYLYCETAANLTANANFQLYYGDTPTTAPSHHRAGVDAINILPGGSLSNKPKPAYQKEGETVVSNLANFDCVGEGSIDIKTLINNTNSAIQDDDKLCISYSISSPTGTVTRAEVESGLHIAVYAVIDLPLSFKVTENLSLDLDELTKDMPGNSSSSDSSANNGSSASDEFKKYIKVIDSVTIKYIAFKLPFYSTQGMMLGVDMIGNGNYERAKIKLVDENKKISESDKSSITLKQATIQGMKDISSFAPKLQLFMAENTTFSIPREKAVKMNIEMNLKTDGTVQVN
jgi:hypothetical protein